MRVGLQAYFFIEDTMENNMDSNTHPSQSTTANKELLEDQLKEINGGGVVFGNNYPSSIFDPQTWVDAGKSLINFPKTIRDLINSLK